MALQVGPDFACQLFGIGWWHERAGIGFLYGTWIWVGCGGHLGLHSPARTNRQAQEPVL